MVIAVCLQPRLGSDWVWTRACSSAPFPVERRDYQQQLQPRMHTGARRSSPPRLPKPRDQATDPGLFPAVPSCPPFSFFSSALKLLFVLCEHHPLAMAPKLVAAGASPDASNVGNWSPSPGSMPPRSHSGPPLHLLSMAATSIMPGFPIRSVRIRSTTLVDLLHDFDLLPSGISRKMINSLDTITIMAMLVVSFLSQCLATYHLYVNPPNLP